MEQDIEKVNLPNRKSIRLKNYDYSSNGAYFVTICTQNREEIFGEMVNGWWAKIPDKFPDVDLGPFQIMPNHIHGIIFINGSIGRTHGSAPTSTPTVGTIIQWFKTMTTNNYINNVKNLNWAPFNQQIWQRNYYEHIIRNEKDLDKISQYILFNPQKIIYLIPRFSTLNLSVK